MCLACSKLLFPFSAVRRTGSRDACLQLVPVPGRHKQLEYNPCFTLFITYFHLQPCFFWALLCLIKMFNLHLGLLPPPVCCWALGSHFVLWWKHPCEIQRKFCNCSTLQPRVLLWKYIRSCKYFDPLVITIGSRNLILMKTSN